MDTSLSAPENARIMQVCSHYDFGEYVTAIAPYGGGHINDTFRIECDHWSVPIVLMQRINQHVFHRPWEVMENIVAVTQWLRKKLCDEGADPERECLRVIPTRDGRSYVHDDQDGYWRVYVFIEGASTHERAATPEALFQSGVAFGRFQGMLSDFPVEKLHETIPGFHDTPARFQRFCEVVAEDKERRVKVAGPEIDFVNARQDLTLITSQAHRAGEIPTRVTHNDTKFDNVMIDHATGHALCVVDLDTVMPGIAVDDFGDTIRSGAATADEDERDLSLVSCSMEMFEAYTRGFLREAGKRLNPREIELLPVGAKIMTFECGMRFLTDYIEGDVYFKVDRPEHNLDRARTQFTLVKDMENKWDEMRRIVDRVVSEL